VKAENPVGLEVGTADDGAKLLDDLLGRRTNKEKKVDDSANHLERERVCAEVDVHAVTVEHKHTVRPAARTGLEVERIRAVQIGTILRGQIIWRQIR